MTSAPTRTFWNTTSTRSAPCGPSTPICCGRGESHRRFRDERMGGYMSVFSGDGPWLTAIIFAVLFLVIFRRPLGWLIKLAFRSLLGFGFLAAWSYSGIAAGLALGVNAFNAITLGLLGLPGLGLLFLLRLT